MLIAGVSMLAMVPAMAHADTAAADYGAADYAAADAAVESDQLGDIIVTADRTETNLQNLSTAVSAISGESLKEANITDITGLNGSVPGLVVARSGGGERIITIRGIGSETPENTNTQPGVSYHIDGVYIFNSIAASAAFIDVGQVEVLRGPQGTMFGQGSTGGTINVVSRQPELGTLSGNAEFGAGNYNLVKADGGVNIPIGETFAIRVAGQHYSHDGYAEATDVLNGGNYELDDADEDSWKAAALWKPTDNVSILLSTIQYESNTHGPAQKNILDPNPDPRELTQDYPARSVVDTELYYGVVTVDTGWATLKSISSYQKLHSEQAWDGDGLTAPLFYALTYSPLTFSGYTHDHVAAWTSDTESWTQELNLSGKTGSLDWIVGAVYLESENKQYINEFRSGNGVLVQPPLAIDTPFDDPLVGTLTYAELSSITRKAWAAYFQGTYDFTPELSVIAGIRYNHDKFSGEGATNSDVPTSGPYLQPTPAAGLTTEEWTGKFALQYKLAPSNMIYASYTRGFKPGGINSGVASGSGAIPMLGFTNGIQPHYQPETVDSIEIGSKNRFLGDTAQLNIAGFYYFYHDMQFLEEDPVLFAEGVSNAPSANIYGIELEGSWLLDDHWKVEGTAAWLKGEFDKDYFALDPAAADAAQTAAGYPGWLYWANMYDASLARDSARQNINGNSVPKLPEWQGSASISYTNIVGPGELLAKAQYVYRGKYQYRLFNNGAFDVTPSYDTVNLYLRYTLDSAPVHFALSVTNVFDEDGVNSRFSDPYGSAQTSETYIPPRQAIFSIGFTY